MIGIGVIGYGYWGPNLARNLAKVADAPVVALADLRPERLALPRRQSPPIQTSPAFRDVLAHPEVDAVAIATPVSTHFEMAMQALAAGKHVWVEKPLAATSEQAARLLYEADRRDLVLMVDHTFVYTGAVRKIRQLVDDDSLGTTYCDDSVRINLRLFQHDVNVLWDLAVHDLAIMEYVLPTELCAISATGMRHIPGEPENIAYLTLFFEGSLIAHIHGNWLAAVKVRRTLIGGSRKMIV